MALFTRSSVSRISAMLVLAGAVAGCKPEPVAVEKPALRYEPTPLREVPDWLKGSIMEQVDVVATEPQRVSNFGFVVNLRNKGDTSAPTAIREYITDQMLKMGVGSPNNDQFRNVSPQQMLSDPRNAIVRVDAFIPPGARAGQRMDVLVTALDENNTQSLAGGVLWAADLAPAGARMNRPAEMVNQQAVARGPIFVNPAYALDPNLDDFEQRRILRAGVIMNGGVVKQDRPLGLRIRAAESRIARMVEARIDTQFQDSSVAAAKDEGLVLVNMPARYKGDWQHFTGVLQHTFFSTNDQFARVKAKQLADEAVKPNAPLQNIAYAFEALGPVALPQILPLMSHSNHDVAYAAAQAAAFIGDPSAEMALAQMAANEKNPNRLAAVQVLSRLPDSPSTARHLRSLLESAESTVRIEAYRALAAMKDPLIVSLNVEEKFILDIVKTDQPTMIYATRIGPPRIAIIGRGAEVKMPIIFTAQREQFSITETRDNRLLTLFYRGPELQQPVKLLCEPTIEQFIARLGGRGPRTEAALDFNYPEVVAILGKMSDQKLIIESPARTNIATTFVLQDLPGYDTSVLTAPIIEGPRPISSTQPVNPERAN
jgi:hypothetical protein